MAARYVDGFVFPIPKRNVKDYRRMAALGCRVWMDHGALDYYEAIGDDLKVKHLVSLQKMAKAKAGETVGFAWIVFKSRAHRDRVNAKVMKDPRMAKMPPKMPFDYRRMGYGGFKIIVSPR